MVKPSYGHDPKRKSSGRDRLVLQTEGLPKLNKTYKRGPGKGQQGKVTCPECGAELAASKAGSLHYRGAPFKRDDLVYPQHRRGGGQYRAGNAQHIRCPASLELVQEQPDG